MSEQELIEAPSQDGGDFSGGDYGNDDFVDESGSTGGQPAPGMGQSKSSRRRRRKRKNKLAGDGSPSTGTNGEAESALPSAPIVMEGESLALASSTSPQPQQPQPRKPQGGGFQNNQGGQQQNGKRWKKKFRDRDRRPPRGDNPGNDSRADNGGSNGHHQQNSYGREFRPDNFGNLVTGFKRKSKNGSQPKDRGFVGPMDHSYREAEDGASAPPSTINLGHGRRGNHRHHGDSQPIDHNMPRPIPIPEDAQTHIYFFIEELFFVAKIQETAKKLGVKVAFIKNDKDSLADLTAGGDENKPSLIVFDLNNANAKPLTLIPKLRTKLKKSVSIVGFLSHLQGDLKAKAVEAGCDVVMPRSAFSQNLPNLLRRYGAEEAEEINYNY